MPKSSKVKVAVMLRPILSNEELEIHWKILDNSLYQVDPVTSRKKQKFVFEHLYNYTDTKTFDQIVKPKIDHALAGYNATCLAYGQAMCGKTHCMFGGRGETGIVELSCEYLFRAIKELPEKKTFLVCASYFEIRNERLVDLLCNYKKDIKIKETAKEGITFDTTMETISNIRQLLSIIEQGNKNRSDLNSKEQCSKAHTIVRIVIESQLEQNLPEDPLVTHCSTINFVDLASSDKSTPLINKSLLQLGTVVHKLSQAGKGAFVDYRSSKLTRILQTSLSGNSHIALICGIDANSLEQTFHTLLFASRAMAISVEPRLNIITESDKSLIMRHIEKIKHLEQQNEKTGEIVKLQQMLISSNEGNKAEKNLRRKTWAGTEMLKSLTQDKPLQYLQEEKEDRQIESNFRLEFEQANKKLLEEQLKHASEMKLKESEIKRLKDMLIVEQAHSISSQVQFSFKCIAMEKINNEMLELKKELKGCMENNCILIKTNEEINAELSNKNELLEKFSGKESDMLKDFHAMVEHYQKVIAELKK